MSEPPRDTELNQSLYAELHDIASKALAREYAGHSLQPTLLVHDAYLRLAQQRNLDGSERPELLAAGATIIRRLLVDHARKRKAQKRGGGDVRDGGMSISVLEDQDRFDLVELHEALSLLEQKHARCAQVVELRFFGGLKWKEIETELGVSAGTVSNDWVFAKAWLYRKLGV
ncbi:MAG: ECF-type sigma factor [Planctomycetota bacterium]